MPEAIAAALARIGVRRVFGVVVPAGGGVGAARAGDLVAALAAVDIVFEGVDQPHDACVMAAVTADLAGIAAPAGGVVPVNDLPDAGGPSVVPGVVVLGAADLTAAMPALDQARRARSPLLVLDPGAMTLDVAKLRREPAGRTEPARDTARTSDTEPATDTEPAIDGEPADPPVTTAEPPGIDPRLVGAVKAIVTATSRSGLVGAARVALEHPRGPVHVSFAAGAASRPIEWAAMIETAPETAAAAVGAADSAVLDAAADLIARSSRPVIVAGLEARTLEDGAWIRAFAEALPAPVVTTAAARGVVPEPHPLALGVLGASPAVLERADLIVTLGLDPAEVEPGGWPWPVPVLDVRPSPRAQLPFLAAFTVLATVAMVLEEFAPRLRGRTRADWDVAELDRAKRALAQRRSGQTEHARHEIQATGSRSGHAAAGDAAPADGEEREPARHRASTRDRADRALVALVREAMPAGTIAVLDASWIHAAAAWQCVAVGELLAPPEDRGIAAGESARSFAIPAAIAARRARPARPIVCFTDPPALIGSFPLIEHATRGGVGFAVIVRGSAADVVLQTAARRGTAVVDGARGALARDVATLALGGRPAVIAAG